MLDETLDRFATLRVAPSRRWDVIVVDNNSTDDTRAVVESHARDFPVRLRYLFEARQGRSSALNAGIAASAGNVIALTDDDVRVEAGWLDAACDELSGRRSVDRLRRRTGAPDLGGAAAAHGWSLTRGDLWGTIAIQDHGDRPFVYEEARKVPLGANMAVRRDAVRSDRGLPRRPRAQRRHG